MQKLRKISIVAATFLLAAATGHVMQTAQEPMPAPAPLRGASLLPQPDVALEAGPQIEVIRTAVTGLTISEVAALPTTTPRPLAAEMLIPPAAQPNEPPVARFGAACAPAGLTLTPAAQGLISVSVAAPCVPNAKVVLTQGELTFAVRLDADGNWSGLVPALGDDVTISARLSASEVLSARQTVEAGEAVNRVILLWSGQAAVHLNAYEYGAEYEGAGHIRAATPRTPDTPLGGYMMVYGDGAGGPSAEVYSAPAAMTNLRIDLEAPVTAQSCGRDLQARVLRVHGGVVDTAVPVSFAMPDCPASVSRASLAETGALPEDALGGAVVMDLPGPVLAFAGRP